MTSHLPEHFLSFYMCLVGDLLSVYVCVLGVPGGVLPTCPHIQSPATASEQRCDYADLNMCAGGHLCGGIPTIWRLSVTGPQQNKNLSLSLQKNYIVAEAFIQVY